MPAPMIRPSSRYFARLCVDSYREDLISARGWRDREADVEVLFDRAPWGVTFTWTGTESFKDALRDVNCVPWYDSRIGWCHRGFLMGVLALWPALQPALEQARQDKVPVYQNGHSLGGSEASIAAGLMVSQGHVPAGLFTIGAPRPAFGGLRRLLAAAGVPVRRYVATGDPVPDVPTVLPWWDHPGDETLLYHPADVDPDHPSSRYLKLIPAGDVAYP